MHKSDFELWCDEQDAKNIPTSFIAKVLVAYPAGLLLGMIVLAYEAFVIMTLWNWFVGAIAGVTMTFLVAYALNLIVGIMTLNPRKRSLYEALWSAGMVVKVATSALVIGFILTLFV